MRIGSEIVVTVTRDLGSLIRLDIDAPPDIEIRRSETDTGVRRDRPRRALEAVRRLTKELNAEGRDDAALAIAALQRLITTAEKRR